jgi:glycine/D-amino acid oxidase-like deaminating enzyme
LHGGCSPWLAAAKHPPRRDIIENLKCDALVVGAGITGSLVAERLTRQGLDVVIVDREIPGHGSTAASTSMLLWEIDRPLSALAEAYGFERAARAYQASFGAVRGLNELVTDLGIVCDWGGKNSLYLAAAAMRLHCWQSTGSAVAPACPANSSTTAGCTMPLLSRAPAPSSRPMPQTAILCNFRAACCMLQPREARGCSMVRQLRSMLRDGL